MSSAHTYTADVAVSQQSSLPEDDEDDICPVCESECTCDGKQKNSATHTSSQPSSTQDFPPKKTRPAPPPLKIRLTVPPTLLARSRGAIIKSNRPGLPPSRSSSPSRGHHLPMTGEFSLSDPRLQNHLLDSSFPKRRGRPPKAVVAARVAMAAAAATSSSQGGTQLDTVAGPSTQGIITSRPRTRAKSKKKLEPQMISRVRGMNAMKSAPKKRTTDGGSYRLRGFPHRVHQAGEDDGDENKSDDDQDEDASSLRFPTFISATSSSSSSSHSSSDTSNSDSEDEDLRMEEESYILDGEQEKDRRNRQHDKARLKRELFGESDTRQKGRSHHITNRWEIKPRRKSVVGSDVDADADMDIDTDDNSTEAEEEEDDRSAEEDDDVNVNEVDRNGRRKLGVSFAGVVTGWSEGEESSYDADIFFANLDGSDSDSGSTMTVDNSSMDADGEDGGPDGDQESADDLDEAMSLVTAAGLEGFPFDVTRGWDGQFMFTNGLDDYDIDMETDLKSTPGCAHRPRRRHKVSSDVDLVSSSLLTSDEEALHANTDRYQDANTDDDCHGYHNGVELAESDGETTEDELVGEDGLPNARAMMLFRWPISVSSVNPMNTLSPAGRTTTTSNGIYNPEDPHSRNSTTPFISTRMTSNDETDAIDRGDTNSESSFDGRTTPSRRGIVSPSPNSASRITPKAPSLGHFEVATDRADPFDRAIIDGQQLDLPSPYPRTRRPSEYNADLGRNRRRILRDRSLSISGQSSIFGDELRSTPSQSTEFEMFSVESMDLDDVLDAAFLASEPSVSDVDRHPVQLEEPNDLKLSAADSRSDVEAGRHLSSLSRWDRIPMATFRRTRESRGSISNDDAGTWGSPSTDRDEFYASAIMNMPLHSMIPQTPKQQDREAPSGNMLGSPVFLNDGDQTASNIRNIRNFHTLTKRYNHPTKSEKEKKEEKKLKQKMSHKASKGKGKSCSPQHQPPHHRHQHHQHHPNSKSRASSSMQRNNFNTSTLPSTNS